jgi:hypothetical protein
MDECRKLLSIRIVCLATYAYNIKFEQTLLLLSTYSLVVTNTRFPCVSRVVIVVAVVERVQVVPHVLVHPAC